MLQKASNEGWKSGYKPRQKAISVHLRVPLCTHGSELPSGAALQRAPPPPAAVADPPACPVHQRPRSKGTDVKEEGKKFLMLINNFQLII